MAERLRLFYNPLQLRCLTQPPPLPFFKFYGWLKETFFAFYYNYLLVTAPTTPTRVTLTFPPPYCAVISPSALSASPSISCCFKWLPFPCIALHSIQLVVEKSLKCTLLKWQEQYERYECILNRKTVTGLVSLHLFMPCVFHFRCECK